MGVAAGRVLITLFERIPGAPPPTTSSAVSPRPSVFVPYPATLRGRRAESFAVDAFLSRVARRGRTDQDTARYRVAVVLAALPFEETAGALRHLPPSFAALRPQALSPLSTRACPDLGPGGRKSARVPTLSRRNPCSDLRLLCSGGRI